MKIPLTQIEAAFDVAGDVFDKKLSKAEGAELLEEVHGLNSISAGDFIEIFRSMMLGKKYQRTLSIDATRYFFARIEQERPGSLSNAIAASVKHLDYYEKLPTGGRQPTKRKLVNEWLSQTSTLGRLEQLDAQFEKAVNDALADSPSVRQARLRDAAKMPTKVQVIAEVYVRNADVVAEVLAVANGVCQACSKPAPFIKKRDGTPFLEVHHRKRLADGGEDTVENAIALCPNCHREMHYGKLD